MTPDARRPRVDDVGVLLPASWWTVPLAEPDARRAAVARLVDEQVGRADVHASLRADLRGRLATVADDAAAAGGRIFAVSFMRAAGVPVPATLTLYRLDGLGHGDLAELETSLAEQPGFDAVEAADGPSARVVRRVSRRAAPDDLTDEPRQVLVVEYWLAVEGVETLVQLAFSSPLVELRDALLELFDTVAASVGPADS
ncbi:hypothetical protein [Cellulomonas sp.]|uniref:hypothetical protein n=1 Tax=Cellulomonas sp. TaxID=40001 RepID=UPI001B28AB14|nr:hypothetical protein [Cellulomonas sp.]MBO9556334.1 hypothetical protein [Cellulomonas sp.]